MLNSIKEFFTQFIAPEANAQHAAEAALPLATAALLIEMMRMDDEITSVERTGISQTLQTEFGLAGEQIETLLQLAEQEARDANGVPSDHLTDSNGRSIGKFDLPLNLMLSVPH